MEVPSIEFGIEAQLDPVGIAETEADVIGYLHQGHAGEQIDRFGRRRFVRDAFRQQAFTQECMGTVDAGGFAGAAAFENHGRADAGEGGRHGAARPGEMDHGAGEPRRQLQTPVVEYVDGGMQRVVAGGVVQIDSGERPACAHAFDHGGHHPCFGR